MSDVVIIFMLCIAGGIIQRTSGFGFGVFIMTMLPFLTPSYGEATALSGLLAMSSSLIVVVKMYKYIRWKRIMPVLITFAAVSAICVSVLRHLDDEAIRRILGVVLIVTSLYFIFFSERIRMPSTLPFKIGTGVIAGVLGGFFGMQGPPAVIYFLNSEQDKQHYMAMSQCFFLVGNACMSIFRAANGFVTKAVLGDFAYGIWGVVVGTAIGALIYKHLPTRILSYIIYIYIGISGVILLVTV